MMRALLCAAGLLLASPGWAGEVAVTIDNFTFSPSVLTVPVGTSVTWTNRDDIPHLVVGGEMHSEALDTDDTFRTTFDKAGTFHYFCSLHPQMQGTVEVR